MKEEKGETSMLTALAKKAVGGLKKNKDGLVVLPPEGGLGKSLSPAEIIRKIEDSVDRLNDLEKKVQQAVKDGKSATKAAKDAKGVKATFGFWEKKEKTQAVIQAMHDADSAQASAIESLSEAQDAQFKFQEDITLILKGLFVMGCGTLAKNRMVVRELQARISGQSEKEIDEMAQRELQTLIDQLNEQRDILERQDQLGKNQKEQAKKIDANKKGIETNASGVKKNREDIQQLSDQDKKQNEEIRKNFEQDEKRDKVISELGTKISGLEQRLAVVEARAKGRRCMMLAALALVVSLAALALVLYKCQ